MKPLLSILDKRFKYRNAANTDVRKTWRRARLLERLQSTGTNVTTIKRKAA